MNPRAAKTKHLRRLVRKGKRASAVTVPLSGVHAARFEDELDSRWRAVNPDSPDASSVDVVENAYAQGGSQEGLAIVLRRLEDEFRAAGRSYAAAAAGDALAKLASAPAGSDIPDGFHPALWPHIRRIETQMETRKA